MNKLSSNFLYLIFGFVAMSSLFGVVQAAWNSPVTSGTALGVTLWNERDDKITQLESRMNIVRNLKQGTVCGVTSQLSTQACRPSDPPPAMACSQGDMIDPNTNPLNFCLKQ